MKKSSLILLALCAGAPLMAQTPNVTFYGVLDAGVAHVQHSLDFSDQFPVSTNPFPQKSTNGATGMFNGGLSQNRVGVKVSTDLTDGWNAFLQLETAFNLTTASSPMPPRTWPRTRPPSTAPPPTPTPAIRSPPLPPSAASSSTGAPSSASPTPPTAACPSAASRPCCSMSCPATTA